MSFSPVRVLAAVASVLALVAAFVVVPARTADAANSADFDPGFLISDADFFNAKALSAAQIDAFIAGMNKGCATGKTCLENYRADLPAQAATTRCAAVPAATMQSAGQAIAAASKACGISPKALLVIVQREQSLVTATAPSAHALNYSMGYGCSDSTGCNVAYAGVFKQIYLAASALKGYTLPSSSLYSRYAAGTTAAIKYHPTASCGTKSVFIKNQATHALYVYTPYTPNAAALKYLTSIVPSGTSGASCASYGNRNFWRLYTDWWGATGSAGALAVDALYVKLGGSSGALGARVGTIATTTAAGAGLYQQYKNGIIAWNLKNGAHRITGDLAASWVARIGDFGWPKQDTVAQTAAGGGATQNFDAALLAQPAGGKVYTVWSGIRTMYLAASAAAGPMGWPTGYQAKDAKGQATQTFTSGTAYRVNAKAGFVATALVSGFTNRGGVTGSLGWPVGFATASALRGGGVWQSFDKGQLLSSTLGTQAIYGHTLAKFKALGGVATTGWPIAARVPVSGSSWLKQDFEKGTILIKGSSSAFVATPLVPTWTASGYTTGTLGAPTGNPVITTANGGGVYQYFKSATVAKQTGGKAYRLTGQARYAWKDTGRAAGTLGWPTASAGKDSSLKLSVQRFQFGVVVYGTTKYGVVGTHEWALAKKHGVGVGALGWPTSTVIKSTAGAGGEYQKFSAGAITWQKTHGAIYVPKSVWSAFTANGGLKGKLGWPIATATTSSAGVTSQKFEGGSISYSKAKGAKITLTSK